MAVARRRRLALLKVSWEALAKASAGPRDHRVMQGWGRVISFGHRRHNKGHQVEEE